MSSAQQLAAEVAGFRRKALRVQLFRAFSFACLGTAVVVGFQLSGHWLWSIAGFALWLGLRVPGPKTSVELLDRVTDLKGELVCAWDNRQRMGPVIEAQRKLAHERYLGRRPSPLVPRPALGWFLPPVLLGGLLLLDAPAELLGEQLAGVSQIEPPGSVGHDSSGGSSGDAPPTQTGSRRSLKQAKVVTTDEQVQDAQTGQEPTPSRPGRGGEASDALAAPSAVARRDKASGAFETGALSVAAGSLPTDMTRNGRALVGQTPPPVDAIVDPARPYPRRYHSIINSWFERKRQ